jgi:hypothetical protein
MSAYKGNHKQTISAGQAMRLLGKTRRYYSRGENAQALVIVAMTFFALLAFVGLLTDVGSIYVTYSRLKNAVDSAAVAAANNIKYPLATYEERKLKITEAAREVLALEHVTDITTLVVWLCNDHEDVNFPPDFEAICPTDLESPRKLAWVQATEAVPVYFLRIFGVESVNMTTTAVGEAATVDLVLVFDTSESMGVNTDGYIANDFDPGACNDNNQCYPLRDAKEAAKSLVSNLFEGYDQVGIVTFDTKAQIKFALGPDIGDNDGACNDSDVYAAIDCAVRLHDDAPAPKLEWFASWKFQGFDHPLNPIYPDDRDGDGADPDPILPCTDVDHDLYDDSNPSQPCDDDYKWDAYNWDMDGDHTDDGDCPTDKDCPDYMSVLSTCTGCGMRAATDMLAEYGRPNGVWVIVFLSDGVANLSDTHATNSRVPASFNYGYCGDTSDSNSFWSDFCIDWNGSGSVGRYCIDSNILTCPPLTYYTDSSKPYSVEDYAYDMTDEAALLVSENDDEPLGQNIIIYSIGLGAASNGEALLRYMANVGDEGARGNDACNPLPPATPVPPMTNCGNYYYAPSGSYLNQIFESIANRIFTKISR